MATNFASQSTSPQEPLHVAIIPDGNGRWARARGLQRHDGHRAGLAAVRRTVSAAPELGIRTLTIYGFSRLNWRRPKREVERLFDLVRELALSELARCRRRGVRLEFIGRRERLPGAARTAIATAESATRNGARLHLRIALDYSAREEIYAAACVATPTDSAEEFDRHLRGEAPDVDLLIRTGGERRLSDFLLWECAHAELLFTALPWPDFDGAALVTALRNFRSRERRFGGLSPIDPDPLAHSVVSHRRSTR